MKSSETSSDPTLNQPAVMVARFACLVGLAAFVAGPPLILTGGFSGNRRLMVYGGLCLVLSALLLLILKRTGRLEEATEAFAQSPEARDPADTLGRLQDRLEALEAKRDTAEFDPWMVLDLRHRIQAHRHKHPDSEVDPLK
jgi:hypothetical protein